MVVCEQHSHNAIFDRNSQNTLSEYAREFQDDALWDTLQHAILLLAGPAAKLWKLTD